MHNYNWVQTACHVNAGCLATGLKILGFMATYFSIASISNWCTCHCSSSSSSSFI